MHVLGSSILATVKQKLRKTPSEQDLQNGEDASPGIPKTNEPGNGNVAETIALATPSPSKKPRGIHEVVSPFIDSEDCDPSQLGRDVEGPDPPAEPSDQTDKSGQSASGLGGDIRSIPPAEPSDQTDVSDRSGNGLVADIGANPQVEPPDQTEISSQSGNGWVADFRPPATPEISDEDAVEVLIGESSSDSENGKTTLGELFARKSVAHPTIKTLLERHDPVNTRALSQELKKFALQLGLTPRNE